MAPIVNGLEASFEGEVEVIRLDAADPISAEWMTTFGVRGHPAFVVLDAQGTVTARLLGPQTAQTLADAVTFALESD